MEKVKVPGVVVVGGKRIRVRWVDDLELPDASGDYRHGRGEIRLRLGEAGWVETLRHEMVHAAFAIGGICWCERFEEEAIVRCLDELFFPAWDALGI